MNKEILFITGNKGKVASMEKYIRKMGFTVKQSDLAIIEPQADTVEEVCLSKARQAYDILKRPLVVHDSGFYIDELNGFPGPYIKFVLETIGVEGIIKMMKNFKNRECRFVQALAYVDNHGNIKIFIDDSEKGRISENVDSKNHEKAWSELWKIYIPDGYDRPLSQIMDNNDADFYKERNKTSVFNQLADWLKKQG